MAKIAEAQKILIALGLPGAQTNEMSALTLLALAKLGPNDPWSGAVREKRRIKKELMAFVREKHGKDYAENTRETFRRQVLHQFVQAHLADYNPFEPNLPTNSPNAHYALSEDALAVVRAFGGDKFDKLAAAFVTKHGSLAFAYGGHREAQETVPVVIRDGKVLELSPGKHNEVEKGVVELFAPRFAQGAELLYLGDTAKKGLLMDVEGLAELGFPVNSHDKLPDVVLYDRKKNWLYLVEAVTSHGPMTPKRLIELKALLKNSKAGLVFVTAFPDRSEFRKHMADIAWETEVWLLDDPDHMIHFNGDRFMGPHGS